MESNQLPLVSIQCLVYNHEPYLRQCLDGFVMQKTNFKFEAIVHDDVSTDGSAAIIREYAEKYPDIIKPIFETENQYSKGDGSLDRIMHEASRGKYIAICEGDDYWTDPLKLQKQVDFMEANLEVAICFHAHSNLMPSGDLIRMCRYSADNSQCNMHDLIVNGGGYMATNSILFKSCLRNPFPRWADEAPVGDLPLMLVLSSRGHIGYINEDMSVYRTASIGSWTSKLSIDFTRVTKHHKAINKMWESFDIWSNYQYHKSVKEKLFINKRNYLRQYIRFLFIKFIGKR